MIDFEEQKQKANELRRAGKFEEALLLYRDLWKETGDKFDGAGLLHCLRKLELFNEAITLADKLIVEYPDFDWCRNEVIWTLISGTLCKLEETEPLGKVLKTAQKVMDLDPDGIAAKMVVFRVLKSAKASNDWKTVNEWVVRIDPNSLRTEPMTSSSGRRGWSDQSLWYNYRINGLVKEGDPNEAIVLVDGILERFPKQRKFFLRLKALAYHLLGNLIEAEKVYQNLCCSYKPDWWLLHEYARVVRDRGYEEDALRLMYQAANSHSKLGSMVSLFEDIGMLCKGMGKYEEARSHLILCKYVREDNEWSVSESVLKTIDELNRTISNKRGTTDLKEALDICRDEWRKLLGKENDSKNSSYKKREPQKGLVGKVSMRV